MKTGSVKLYMNIALFLFVVSFFLYLNRELRHAINCLEEAVDECPNDEDKEEVADGLGELESLMRESCENRGVRQKPVVGKNGN